MAIAVASSNSSGPVNTTTGITITKPTGLAIGDLLVGVFGLTGITTADNMNTPAGWTSALNSSGSNDGLAKRGVCLYKVADSGDVSASDFSFTTTGGQTFNGWAGAIFRVTGAKTSSVGIQGTFATAGNTGSPSFANTVTPNVADSLILMAIVSNNQGASIGVSNYAIATNNPTWTENVDIGSASVADGMSFAVANATRPQITATGNSSVSLNNANSYSGGSLVVIEPSVSTENGNFFMFFN